ncbi:metal ABC transporter solute-binding protein, Zn/Mn family [Acetomicrobium hydrogeniformans]|uniref:Zinc ABC transporter solute-binding protein n=1 Tax=Acetomicrobium hydrogeniformans TaxID=649746 RepID=A0A7V6ZDM1_9BACT|nr:zinc ABC transporter substrate-binding protein [Acetomicrobium hydrogeniformans]HHZ04030.1 zinc ABC transporter solute-binding protein [Acetomicrobium hydrogeniformans]
MGRMIGRRGLIKILLLFLSVILFLDKNTSAFADNGEIVFVSVPPIAYFVEKIGGETIRVQSLINPGDDPHVYEPKPKQMVDLSKARLYSSTNFPFERNLLTKIKATNPNLIITDTGYGISYMEDAAHKGHEGKDGFDPHIWTSPLNAFKIAENIYRGLVSANPEEVEIYRKNYLELLRGIAKLDKELWERSKSARGKKFLVFHPAWSYFARDYGLIQVSVEQEGKEPRGAQLSRLIEDARKEGIKVLFVSPQHSKRSAKTIADAIGAEIVEIDPLSKKWDENLRSMVEILCEAL